MSRSQPDPDPDIEPVVRKAGRPRSARSHQAILDATLELFAEVGFQGLTIEGVAERAGVGKTTIYRRWSSKEDLIKDAVNQVRIEADISDTGNIRNDLLHLLKVGMEVRGKTPLLEKLFSRLMAEVKTNPEFAQFFYQHLLVSRIDQSIGMIRRAQARGALRPDLDPMLVLTLIGGPLLYYVFLFDVITPMASMNFKPEEVVDAILLGISAQPSDLSHPEIN